MNTTLQRFASGALAATVAIIAAAPIARACPFCNAAMQTLSQEMESADVTLIAELIQAIPTSQGESTDGVAVPAAKFRVVEVLHGEEKLEGRREIDVIYFGDEAPDKKFLITGLAGVTGPALDWTTPVPLSDAAVAYVRKLPTIPAEGVDRLAFFQEYLEHDDPLLAQDAYDEFARTPYAQIIELAPRMNRSQLLRWIEDASVGPSSRRLYLTLLGVCGQSDDVALLEQLMNYDYLTMKPAIAALIAVSGIAGPAPQVAVLDEVLHADERRKRESLDALVACYLKLKGPAGLELVNRLFLGNPQAEFRHLHSAIMALRFHGEETDVLPREQLLDSMRLALNHREFADQVIPDLTRWEDWEVMPRLVTMFKEADEGDWIRQPVVGYLLVAAEVPGDVGEQARTAIADLETIDAKAVESARTTAAFNFLSRPGGSPAGASAGDATTAATDAATSSDPAATAGDANEPAASPEPAASDAATAPVADPPVSPAPPTEQVAAAASAAAAAATPPAAAVAVTPPSRIKIIGIPLLAAVVLLAIFAVLLRGADPRSSDENP